MGETTVVEIGDKGFVELADHLFGQRVAAGGIEAKATLTAGKLEILGECQGRQKQAGDGPVLIARVGLASVSRARM